MRHIAPEEPLCVVVACDKFKGPLTSAEVAQHVGDGILAGRPDAQVEWVPVADGGDGSLDVAMAAGAHCVEVATVDAHGQPLMAPAALEGATATIEVARICGLGSREPDGPESMTASSLGVGHAMRAVLDRGATRVFLAVGGTSTTDGGAGMLQALGVRLLTAGGRDIELGGGALGALSRVDLTDLDPRLRRAQIIVASDVDNPLLGPDGAAAVYGPQKGAGPLEVEALDRLLNRWARLVALGAGLPDAVQDLAHRSGAVPAAASDSAHLSLEAAFSPARTCSSTWWASRRAWRVRTWSSQVRAAWTRRVFEARRRSGWRSRPAPWGYR